MCYLGTGHTLLGAPVSSLRPFRVWSEGGPDGDGPVDHGGRALRGADDTTFRTDSEPGLKEWTEHPTRTILRTLCPLVPTAFLYGRRRVQSVRDRHGVPRSTQRRDSDRERTFYVYWVVHSDTPLNLLKHVSSMNLVVDRV